MGPTGIIKASYMTSSERTSLSLKEDMWALIPPTVIAYRKKEENAAF